ncbi:hypothetical protein [Flavihumibacter petaseus]|uniref:Uncharacterized protein n=1 Tax=Flavihumibacter petaseus NBRC 106054 TaxID=1220578 RepID=A0A0E9N6C3_9BACT|nr:hypothetical protein [Flavihumibacter petaseus]GAO45271.1 hypothetical protein FPE01S_04_05150 [Flavihumibacter petaseus NBRC 106054]
MILIFYYFTQVKKLAAILLCAVLLFNWVGYRFFFNYVESSTSQRLNTQLDEDIYNESELITIKIPVQGLPYYTNSPVFDRVKGSITIGGLNYQYVEKRIYNDSVEMRCIPNAQATHISNARDAFFQMVADLQQTNSSGKHAPVKPTISLKTFLPDCVVMETRYLFEPSYFQIQKHYPDYSDHLPVSFLSSPEHPPTA